MTDNIDTLIKKVKHLPTYYRDIVIRFIVARFIYSNEMLCENRDQRHRDELLQSASAWAKARNELIDERMQALMDTEIIPEKIGDKYHFPDPDLRLLYKQLQRLKR